MSTKLEPDLYACFDKNMEHRAFAMRSTAERHSIGGVTEYVKVEKVQALLDELKLNQQVPVGEIVANDPVHGWHFKPYIGWEEIGAGTKLFSEAPRPEAPLALAKNLAMHANEASILAGNDVCQKLMQECSKMITTLVQALENK